MADSEDRRVDDIDVGTPGGSAWDRYERLRRRDDERRRRRFGRLAPIVAVIAGPKSSTEAWARGSQGEQRIGAVLTGAVGSNGVVLHDRRIPGSRANLDHVAIVRSGIWVVDAKNYRGSLERRSVGGWFTPRQALYVGRRDRTELLASARRQRAEVARRVPPDVVVRAVLCFTGVELGLFARPFTMHDVLVTWPKALVKTLDEPGPLDPGARRQLAEELARAFPAKTRRPTG